MKAALISGAAGGMGVATTSAFLNAGWCVFACDNDEDRLVELTSEDREPKRVASAALDLGEASSCTEAVRLAVERFGRLDALVNMAGIGGPQASLETLTPEDWSKILNTNLMSAVFLTTAAIPHLRKTRGVVVNIASTSAYQAEPGQAAYAVSKAGMVAFTNNAACELGPYGVRVVAISPGWIDTPMSRPCFEELGMAGEPVPMTMLRRIGKSEDIAATVMFLVSEGAANITGTAVIVDGGQTNHGWPIPQANAVLA